MEITEKLLQNAVRVLLNYQKPFAKQVYNILLARPLINPVRYASTINIQLPKQPASSFVLFFNDKRPDLLKENPGANSKQLVSVAGKLWHSLEPAEKQIYQLSYAEKRKTYSDAMKSALDSLSKEQIETLRQDKQDQRLRREKTRLRSLSKKLGKPIQPAFNGCAYFIKDNSFERGSASATEYLKGVVQQWNRMTVDEKKPYNDKARENKEKYQLELAQWENQMIKDGHAELVRASVRSKSAMRLAKPKKPAKKSTKTMKKANPSYSINNSKKKVSAKKTIAKSNRSKESKTGEKAAKAVR